MDYIAAATAPEGQSAVEYRADMVRERSATIPLGRLAVAADIARLAAFLSSDEADYVTGQAINMAGVAKPRAHALPRAQIGRRYVALYNASRRAKLGG